MKLLERIFGANKKKDIPTSSPQTITFAYALNHPEVQVMSRNRSGLLEPIKNAEPFVSFKARTIAQVEQIYTGPENEGITSKNVTAYIEEPCIPTFLKMQRLGIQTAWSSANGNNTGKYRSAVISIVPRTLSEENLSVVEALGLPYAYDGYCLEIPIELADIVEEVSDKFLELCDHFVEQPVLYGHRSQSEYLNAYCKHSGSHMKLISNIDEDYMKDHLTYLLTNFSQYISFDGEKYTCRNMPDEMLQGEMLDRELLRRFFLQEPSVCINGVVWESKELYDINEHNTRGNLDKTSCSKASSDFKGSLKEYPRNEEMPVVKEPTPNDSGIQKETPERE